MVTIGIGFVARGLVTMIPGWGTDTHVLETPFRGEIVRAGGLVVAAEHLVIIAATVLLVATLYAFFRFSRVGIAMQAASQNQLAAYYMGIPVRRLNGLIWAISAAVAALAGLLLAPLTFVHVNMGFIGLKAFPAAVVGGFGSLPGAIVGGVIIGVVEALSGVYLPEGFKDVAAYVVVLVMLAVRPEWAVRRDDARRRYEPSRTANRLTQPDALHLQDRLRAGPAAPQAQRADLLVRGARCRPCPRPLAALALFRFAAHVRPDLFDRGAGADAAVGLHGPDLAGSRGVPGRGRLHGGRARSERLAVSVLHGRRRPHRRHRRRDRRDCRPCA